MKWYRGDFVKVGFLLSLCLSAPVAADQHECSSVVEESVRRQAEQKVLLLERLVSDTEPVRRVLDSGRQDAVAAIEAAREAVVRAHQDLDRGCTAAAAESATTGLNQASEAFRLARDMESSGAAEYQSLQRRAASFLDVLESQAPEARGISAEDLVGMQRQVSRAEAMAVDNNYTGATNLLKPVADRLERRLIAIFDQRTVYYEREFSSLEEEYDYIAEQYRGYELLLDQMTSERPLPFSVQAGYDTARQEGARLDEVGAQLAETGSWEGALARANEALEQCERALRLLGIRY